MEYPYQFAVLLLDGNGTSESAGQLGVKIDGTEPFTIDAWVKPEDAPGKRTIMAQKDGFAFGIDGQSLYFNMAGYPAVYCLMNNDAVSPREWMHLCVVYDMSGVLLYINGVSDAYTAISGKGSYKEEPVIFGQNFQGMIRQVRIFHCALTAEQINGYMMSTDLSDETFQKSLAAYFDFSQIPAVERIKQGSIVLKETAEQQLVFSGISFEGNSFLTIDDEPQINPAGNGNDSYTVQAWFFLNPNEFEDRYTIFANGDVSGVAGMSLFVERINNGYYIKALRGSGTQKDDIIVSGDAVSPEQWTNVAVTYDVDTMKLYVNGKISGSVSGLFPIPVRLLNQQPRVGSEVIENDVNGQYWFSGSISRLDIWERALSEDEILRFALEQPDMDAEGILGCYFLNQKDTGNLCTGRLLGERNNPELKEFSVKAPKEMRFAEPGYGNADMENPLPLKDLEQYRKMVLEQRNGENAKIVYTVTSHKIGDTIYFVAHEKDISYTVCYGRAGDIDALTQWYIELILIVLGGVVKIVFGARIQSSGKKLLTLIRQATENPFIRTVLTDNITVKSIIEIFKILYNAGFLYDMLRACLSGFSFWKVSWMIAKIIILACASIAGGWAYYAAALAELVIELVNHGANYPEKEKKKEIQIIGLSAVCFQSDLTVPLRLNSSESAPVPEWTSKNTENSHTAYSLKAMGSGPVTIQASFRSTRDTTFPVEVKCESKSPDGIFGNSDIVSVSMGQGLSDPLYVKFTFKDHHMNNGVRYAETEFSWKYKNSSGVWQEFAVSKHKIYVILMEPKLPWSAAQAPWCEVLKYACTWGEGAGDKEKLAGGITAAVNESLGLQYNTDTGAPFYVGFYMKNEVQYVPKFNLTRFLDHISGRQPYSNPVNCMDCATICATFANAAGVGLSEKRMENTWEPDKGFSCNEIQAIGYNTWEVPFKRGFSYHEVCMMEPLQQEPRPSEVSENNYYIYDACLKVDGSADPESAAERNPCLPMGMHFSEFGDVNHVDDIPAFRSYREHLAVNSQEGIGSCLYCYDYNGESELIYKQVE